jgi:hypothetical protein
MENDLAVTEHALIKKTVVPTFSVQIYKNEENNNRLKFQL